jgi:hypothetical protein
MKRSPMIHGKKKLNIRGMSLAWLLGVFHSLECSALAAPRSNVNQPTSRQLWDMVFLNQDVRLIEGKHVGCSNDMGRTLGAYVAFLLGTLSDSGKQDTQKLQAHCLSASDHSPLPPTKKTNEWNCAVEAYTSDKAGESPWSYGLHFRVRAGKLDKKFLACPGA